GVVDLSSFGWGIDSFPACFLENDFLGGSFPSGSCNPVELTIRQSFRRIEDTDYEPVHWDGFRFQAYGPFYVERYGFARNYGMSDDKWHRFAARYNIWERSHFYTDPDAMAGPVECFTPTSTPYGSDPHRDENNDGTEDECAQVGNGSRCDTFSQKCTLPFQDRVAKPVAWHYTEDGDPNYVESTWDATHEWDVAMRSAVQTAKYAECTRVGGADCVTRFPVYFGQQDENDDAIALAREVDDCRYGRAYTDLGKDRAACDALADEIGQRRGYAAGVIALAKMDEMIVLCHGPVEAGDHAACGDKRLPEGITANMCLTPADEDMAKACDDALSVRRGDLRYHQIVVIQEPQTPSPWGIYTDAEDPLTGETVSASINVWSSIGDRWSQGLIDKARYIAGELKTSDVTEGENVSNWAQANEAASRSGVLPQMTKKQIDRRLADFVKASPERIANPRLDMSSPVMQRARVLKQEMKGIKAKLGAATTKSATYAARRARAAGTEVEAQLMTGMMQELHGAAGLPMTDGVLDMISPLRGGNPSFQRDLYNLKEKALAERGACMLQEATAPIGMAALSKQLQEKFGAFDPESSLAEQGARAEKMRRYLAQKAHKGVIAHEMGHSIGMRHNFISSADAMVYRPQYWQLRTQDGTETTECTDLAADGSTCVGPRYFDPVTDEENDNLIWMFMQSTVMDYPGESTQELLGLGPYDFAAARMFYGDTVAVYSDASYRAATPRGRGVLAKMDNFGGILGLAPQIGADEIHYSALQNNFQLISDCATISVDEYKPAGWDEALMGPWSPLLDGQLVSIGGQATRCKQPKVDYAKWDSLRLPTPSEAGNFYRGGVAIDSDGRTRVPYGFATDGWADLGNLSVYRSDNGADPYELFNFLITQREVNHIFDDYRRGRQGFSVKSAAYRSLGRYQEKLRDAAKGLGLLKNIYENISLEEGYDFGDFWPDVAPFFFKENVIAAGIGFDHFTKLLARPASGNHFFIGNDSVLRSDQDSWADANSTRVIIPNGATGAFGDVDYGGAPLENSLAEDQGEFDSDYTINAGSYYDKVWTAMLMTESIDNFISSDRSDFYDARYRSVSVADLFPDGYRRWLGNNLTGDDAIKGARVAADEDGRPLRDVNSNPARGIGWVSWWPDEPVACFPGEGSRVCSSYGRVDNTPFEAVDIQDVAYLDPQVGWEQQKFLIAWTLIYLPENQQQWWIDNMRLWELGTDADPGIESRIEFHAPGGKRYVAQTFGKEVLFGKTVQKGIAARVLEYANELMVQAYEVTPGPDLDGDTEPDWYTATLNDDGQPIVRWDATVDQIVDGNFVTGRPGCNETENFDCTCASNRACSRLRYYVQVPFFLRQSLATFGMHNPDLKGIY
ncbi:MAG: hypothetical protein ACI9MR_003567, partial [Myxococcota bacterium]